MMGTPSKRSSSPNRASSRSRSTSPPRRYQFSVSPNSGSVKRKTSRSASPQKDLPTASDLMRNIANVDTQELLLYYKHKEEEHRKLNHVNRMLWEENEQLKRRVLENEVDVDSASQVLLGRSKLLSMLYDVHKASESNRNMLMDIRKDVSQKCHTRTELLHKLTEVVNDANVAIDGSKWILQNMFQDTELLHIGASSVLRSTSPSQSPPSFARKRKVTRSASPPRK
eukprot:TRINITY_DN28052_c0_g1_i1.p1 TRINITY_DN28052_c0_g1~~TRINITY_DN28052_c0_g1_i1.p1  ORF type:complete len:226 (+),score=38.30 TRINITY_DN28052_c0_g1_i1:37-714(+)